MPSLFYSLPLLLVLAFGGAAWLEPWFQSWAGNRNSSGNVLTALMGDSRRLFAQHFYFKADAYFHSGYYPSVFDTRPKCDQLHEASHGRTDHEDHDDELGFLQKPNDWIDRFSRHFYPSRHVHLGEESDDAEHDHSEAEPEDPHEAAGGEEREILPWLRLALELDPQRPETYVVSSYWLRSRLDRVDEAEQFLREGLRHNPDNEEILFELGRIYRENRQDSARARNLWELSLQRWKEHTPGQAETNRLLQAQILGNLAKLEAEEQNIAQAIGYLRELESISPNKEKIRAWIDDLERKSLE